MSIETELDRKAMLADFGVLIALQKNGTTQKTVKGLFDSAVAMVDAGNSVISTNGIQVHLSSSDSLNVVLDDTMVISGRSYKVADYQDDGTGITTYVLYKVTL